MLSLPGHCNEASEILMMCFVPSVGSRSFIRAPCGATAMPFENEGSEYNTTRGKRQQETEHNRWGDPKGFGRRMSGTA